ncbi:DUF1232 domain-containing protein [Promicromonospora citrea]|uniref:DUF1232 domain-containing protein n=1 Tax=Promicromonospora citrea TaxID=43677 RepID=A0A8H9GPW5_9MICO|nr:DUF1232 domain-containing protein [Promicromonospora citrea]NNH55043.1 DUF1232 domain-containing protein [Promicromonospora citrea]GGM42582.1 hypothetical protein GCM10010102_42640 [Promicromonospora citrea]
MGEDNKRGRDPRKFTWQEILTFIAGAGYVASPIDLLSEGVLGPLGLGDDAIAIVVAGVTLYKALKRFREHRATPGAAGSARSGSTGSGSTGTPGASSTAGPSGAAGATGGPAPEPAPGKGKIIPGTAEDVTDRRPRR